MKSSRMKCLKEEAVKTISRLPESAGIDEILYRLYIIGKIRNARDAFEQKGFLTSESVREEIRKW